MSGTLVKNTRVAKPALLKEPRRRVASQSLAKVTSSPVGWVAVSCVLLGISGGIHQWRDWKFQTLAQNETNCPFRLKELPRVLGNWRATDDPDGHLEPDI